MNLREALGIISTPSAIRGDSAQLSVDHAQVELIRSTAREVPLLDGGTAIRLADVLANLADATRLTYEPDVFDTYRQWAQARYIGAFDLSWPMQVAGRDYPRVELSSAGRRVVMNQRRVLSEDLGVGVAYTLAQHWAESIWPRHDIHMVEIDVAMDRGLIPQTQGRRADYLILGHDPGLRETHALAALECKGSESRSHALKQLSSGAKQIEDTCVLGQQVRGLVSSLHSGRGEVQYFAAEVRPPDLHPPLLVDTAAAQDLLGVTWAKVAEVADEPAVYERYAPDAIKGRRGPSQRKVQGEKRSNEIAGRRFVGTEALIPLPGGELRYFLGADAALVDSLVREDVEAALSMKAELRSSRALIAAQAWPFRVEGLSASGLGLVLELVG